MDWKEFLVGAAILNERASGASKRSEQGLDAAVDFTFSVFDEDGIGLLPQTVLGSLIRKCFPELPEAKVNVLVAESDTNCDGMVSREEFRSFCRRHQQHSNAMRKALFGGTFALGTGKKED